MEEEALNILRSAVSCEAPPSGNFYDFFRRKVEAFGGVVIEPLPRHLPPDPPMLGE